MRNIQQHSLKSTIAGVLAFSAAASLMVPSLVSAAPVSGAATLSINNPVFASVTTSAFYPVGTIISAYFDSTHDNDTITLTAPALTIDIPATSTDQWLVFPVNSPTPPASTNPANRFPQATTMDTGNTAVGQIGLSGALRNTNANTPYTNYLQFQDFSVEKINGVWNVVTHDNVGGAETLFQLVNPAEALDVNGNLTLSGDLVMGDGTNAYTLYGRNGPTIPGLSPWVNFLQVLPAQYNTVVGHFNLQPLAAAPTGLAAIPVSSTQINLSWADNANNEAAQYLERCQGGGCSNFVQIAAIPANTTAYNDTGLTAGTSYSYRIRAHGPTADSAYSNTDTAVTPTALPAAPSNLSSNAKTKTMVNLTWVDNSSNELNFKLERCKGQTCNNFVQIAAPAANATSFSNSGLTKNTWYRYRIRAYNAAGNSVYSNIYCVKTLS
ncbi:MAG: fibronectin type III domain-containing protein [Methylococcales bacterium]